MKRLLSTFLMILLCFQSLFASYHLELNTSYDYFRGMPDGSWNGNNGVLIAANSGMDLFDCMNAQLGGSYGLYNWDGRGNLVFENPKVVEQIGFLTVGVSSSFREWSAGLVYDRMFASHFGIYDLSPSIDQLRYQLGYLFCSDEVGFWGTVRLARSLKNALGVPTKFQAIGQMNLFWSHFFENCAQTTLWLGIPYQDSLMYSGGKAGKFIAGFSFRVPLAERLSLDGNASYMAARTRQGAIQSRNYGSNICVGITYCFNGRSESCNAPYMSIANHSNFFVDTNINQ